MSKRSGSALVIVLLLLVLLLGLTLYYLAMVRLEGQTTDAGAARRLVSQDFGTALAEAQQQIRESMEDRPYVTTNALGGWVSKGSGAVSNFVGLSTAEDLGWPIELRGNGEESLFALASNAEEILVGDTDGIHTAVAWVAVDLSGLLDPNALDGLVTRDLNYDPAQHTNRVYLSAREFSLVNSNAVPVFVPGAFSRDRGWYDEVAHTWRTNSVVGATTLSMNPLEWTQEQALAVFTEELYPQFTADELSDLTNAFLDFRNGKEVPTDPLGITAVPVPMFNEVWAKVIVENDGDRVTLIITLTLEIWRPYPGNDSSRSYRVPKTPAIVSPVSIPSGDSVSGWEFKAPIGNVSQAFQSLVVTFPPRELPGLTAGSSLDFQVDLSGLTLEQVVDEVPGEESNPPPVFPVVDQIPSGLLLDFKLIVPEVGAIPQEWEFGLEVTDPRINHLIVEWKQSTAKTPNSINAAALALSDRDGFACWTPAGRSNEWQAAWIGFLPLPDPWKSVDLFDEDGAWWLKHTRDSGTEFGKWKRGLVNPNSLYEDALASVWVDAPNEQWPGEVEAPRLTIDQARAVAEGLIEGEGTVHRGEWARYLGTFLTPETDRGLHAEESLVRHALSRLESAQQLVGIVLLVERRAPGGRVLARRREALIWWRDPYGNPAIPGEGRILWRSPLPNPAESP